MKTALEKHFVPGRPDKDEHAEYYGNYISRISAEDIISVLENQIDETRKLFASIPDAKGTFRYAEGKWSINELMGHIIDAERVMAYRALCFARADAGRIPGMDQDLFAANAHSDNFSLSELVEEFLSLRKSHVLFFKHLDEAAWHRRGTASDCEFSVRALAYILAGHLAHHFEILKERYLV
jgi:hypothetical protein